MSVLTYTKLIAEYAKEHNKRNNKTFASLLYEAAAVENVAQDLDSSDITPSVDLQDLVRDAHNIFEAGKDRPAQYREKIRLDKYEEVLKYKLMRLNQLADAAADDTQNGGPDILNKAIKLFDELDALFYTVDRNRGKNKLGFDSHKLLDYLFGIFRSSSYEKKMGEVRAYALQSLCGVANTLSGEDEKIKLLKHAQGLRLFSQHRVLYLPALLSRATKAKHEIRSMLNLVKKHKLNNEKLQLEEYRYRVYNLKELPKLNSRAEARKEPCIISVDGFKSTPNILTKKIMTQDATHILVESAKSEACSENLYKSTAYPLSIRGNRLESNSLELDLEKPITSSFTVGMEGGEATSRYVFMTPWREDANGEKTFGCKVCVKLKTDYEDNMTYTLVEKPTFLTENSAVAAANPVPGRQQAAIVEIHDSNPALG